ncbi:hypothetical protein K437DRAFT_979 [Tilletiaria anomala UBC 951]|uniref:Uncharacterized protein n=1 Tax=Tilletiaria anomala (strain ATCC 24038 / CBS 436.72 / UBC 951) TaxID=1037660 RepID=A0A066WHQ0_TILAU|nr:uncharacterized protein K437DRAFT_979 [Tilletiaria anomala UBC 951]KDN53532.1 hypothetical protein K437DRAFT_979 [Tilletiaria anomala UBC 951]
MPLRQGRAAAGSSGLGPGPPAAADAAATALGPRERAKPDLAALKAQHREQQLRKQQQRKSSSASRGPSRPAAKKADGAAGIGKLGSNPASDDDGGDGGDADANGDAAFSTTSESDGRSDDEEAAALAEMDGQELWAQTYCCICDRLIEPGTGIAANGKPVNASAAAEALKKAIEAAAAAQASRNATRAAPKLGAASPLRRSGSAGSRVNPLSELRPTTSANSNGQQQHRKGEHKGTASGGGGAAGHPQQQHSRPHSRESSVSASSTRSRKSPARSRRNSAVNRKAAAALASANSSEEPCSPVEPRSGMATPPGIGSGLARSQEEKRLRKEGLLQNGSAGGIGGGTGAAASAVGGGGILGPLTPMLLKEQEQLENAMARAPQALYCSQACREMDEQRSAALIDVNPYMTTMVTAMTTSAEHPAPPLTACSLSFGAGSYGAAVGANAWGAAMVMPPPGPGTPGTWSVSGPPSAGLYTASAAPWAQMPIGPSSMGGVGAGSFSASAGSDSFGSGYFPADGTSWGHKRPKSSQSGVAYFAESSYAYAYQYAYPYGAPGGVAAAAYAPSRASSRTPDLDCTCAECQATLRAMTLSRNSRSRAATPASVARPSETGKEKEKGKGSAVALGHAGPLDNVSAIPSGASDTTESSGGYPYGPVPPGVGGALSSTAAGAGTMRAKKRTQSGRVETPLNLLPGQAAAGDYFASAAHQQGAAGRQQQQQQKDAASLGIGSASTNGTEDSTLSWWEKPHKAHSQSRAAAPRSPRNDRPDANDTRSAADGIAAAANAGAAGVEAGDKKDKCNAEAAAAYLETRPLPPRRSSTVSTSSPSGSPSYTHNASPLRLLKRDSTSAAAAAPLTDVNDASSSTTNNSASAATAAAAVATVATAAQPSTSLSNASGLLSRSLASEYTELGTSATTTGTFDMARSSTIRDRRHVAAGGSSSFGGVSRHRTHLAMDTSVGATSLATSGTPVATISATQADPLVDGGAHAPVTGYGPFRSDVGESAGAESISSAIESLRLAQARSSIEQLPSHGSLSRLWGSSAAASRRGASANADEGALSPERGHGRRGSHRWSVYSESSSNGRGGSAELGSLGSSSSSGWWRSLVPAWASIKALQALSNSQDSDDEREDAVRGANATAHVVQYPSEELVGPSPGLVKPSGRRDQVPDFAHEIGHGAIPGEGRELEQGSALGPSVEDDAEALRRRKAERERAHKHQRSKDAHVLPPLLAPSRSSSNTNLRMAHPRASRSGSQSYTVFNGTVVPSPFHGSFGAARSTTPGVPSMYGVYRSTTPGAIGSSVAPPSPGLRAMRNPANRGSCANLPTLGEAMIRPPSRTGSAMGVHAGSLSASPRRAGLGWGPLAPPPPPLNDAAYPHVHAPANIVGRPGGAIVTHPHAHRHHHHHHHHHHHAHGGHHGHHHGHASYDSSTHERPPAALCGSFEEAQRHVGDQLSRPGSAIGHGSRHPRPRSVYGSYGHAAPEGMHPSMSAVQLSRAPSNEPTRTWSYERMPGLKTYPVMQLPNRKPTHDVYDNWSEALAKKPLAEDPAEEAKADAEADHTPSTIKGDAQRKKLFFFSDP